MRIKTIIPEDFINYKLPSMFIGTISCGGKCCIEAGIPLSVCQNDEWRNMPIIYLDDNEIIKRYMSNMITNSIIFGGLEPIEQFDEILAFIIKLRTDFNCEDDVVIYTGYNENEIANELSTLQPLGNIVVKFGRYIPNKQSTYDDVLGVTLCSDNQYAKRL